MPCHIRRTASGTGEWKAIDGSLLRGRRRQAHHRLHDWAYNEVVGDWIRARDRIFHRLLVRQGEGIFRNCPRQRHRV